MLAADALVRQRRNLSGKPGKRRFRDAGAVMPLDLPAKGLDPELPRTIDIDVGHVGPRQHRLERSELRRGRTHFGAPAALKSRSCATNTLMLLPAGTVRVGTYDLFAGVICAVAAVVLPGS